MRQFLLTRLESQHAIDGELAAELRSAARCSRLGGRLRAGFRVAGGRSRRQVADIAGRIGEGEGLAAGAARDPQHHVAVFRHGEDSGAGIAFGGQEDRRPARVGRRRDPGVDARRERSSRRARAESVRHAAAERAKGKGEGDEQHQRCNRTQRPRVALGHAGARQILAKAAEPRRHPTLMLTPECGGKAVLAAARPVRLHRQRVVHQPVGALDTPVDLGRAGVAIETQRIERRERREREADGDHDARRIRDHAEEAEPGDGKEQADDDEKRQDQGPEPLQHDRKAGDETGASQPPGKRSIVVGVRLSGHSSFFRHPPRSQ
jgi:hypothetical protein